MRGWTTRLCSSWRPMGDADKIIWTKLNAEDMSILAEGTLELPLPQGAAVVYYNGYPDVQRESRQAVLFLLWKGQGWP